MADFSESSLVWMRCKEVFGGQKISRRLLGRRGASTPEEPDSEEHLPFGPKRDPQSSGAVLGQLFAQFDWQTPLAQARVIDGWEEFAGARTAAHTKPLYVEEGVLLVQCDSTAWATQLRSIRGELLGRIRAAVPEVELDDIKFLNPGAPSWRHGNRSVPGRGPRDTYG
ncbi:DUF721 domain-containing protein [Gulosibacter faecalis]|jgi:predicted nucleic acid-binding Zn ribbon protein|uniref:DUF721 domain-containing protein n=1 Tax=Gulosibacter faecalis TaxID=272240 RepID=A0ABW5UXG3_9MICO|nr:DciA family protein [Gulosibacter faecalis]